MLPGEVLISGFDILLIAGGASGGGSVGGGGGAGGILYAASVSLASGAYVINVGDGGASSPAGTVGNDGSNTTFGDPGGAYLTALGGGGGAAGAQGGADGVRTGNDGGSGGGGSQHPTGGNNFGGDSIQTNTWTGPSSYNASATITAYGNDGQPAGPGQYRGGGGAGGTSGAGTAGGPGQQFSVVTGPNFPSIPGAYGAGGTGASSAAAAGPAGADNTGNGGTGGWNYSGGSGGAGGSGVAFLIVPATNAPRITTPAPSVLAGDGSGRSVFKFTSTGPTTITVA